MKVGIITRCGGGEILLRSTDPREPPRIAYNFFSAPDDLPRLREGVKRARAVAYQPAMAAYRGREVEPGEQVKSDAEIDAFIRRTAITAHHPCGTCAMGLMRSLSPPSSWPGCAGYRASRCCDSASG
jgi:choline dehydrogenase-like flavoprotein